VLKSNHENSHATLVGCFLAAIQSLCPVPTTKATKDLVAKLLPQTKNMHLAREFEKNIEGMEEQRFGKACEMFEGVERVWRWYKYRKNFKNARIWGLVEKETHTIIAKWPYRIDTQQDFAAVKADFELRRKGTRGGERFVEWKRQPGTFISPRENNRTKPLLTCWQEEISLMIILTSLGLLGSRKTQLFFSWITC
jgi:hypothetical protein